MTTEPASVYCIHTATETPSPGVRRCLNCHLEWLEPPADEDVPEIKKIEKPSIHTGATRADDPA